MAHTEVTLEDAQSITGSKTLGSLNNVVHVDGFQYATIAAAVTAVGSSGTIVIPPSGSHYNFNSTIPAGVTLRVEAGAILDVAMGSAPAINGNLDAGWYQIFNVSSQAITAAAVTSGTTATYTVASTAGLVNGSQVTIMGFTGADAYFNQSCSINGAPTGTTFTCALTHANTSATTTGTVYPYLTIGLALKANWFNGSDIGAQINAAYAALQQSGGVIYVNSPPSSQYSFSTPIVFTTSQKNVKLEGIGSSTNELQLNYTPTTATSAMYLDFVQSGGYSNAPGFGIRNIALKNNNCNTRGGCGGSAAGITIGGTNAGAQNADFTDVLISGFAVGTLNNAPLAVASSWGMVWNNCSWSANVVGYRNVAGNGAESTICHGCKFAGNGTGLDHLSGNFYLYNSSIDGSVTLGINVNGAFLNASGVHWENCASGCTTHYLAASNSWVTIRGGYLAEDVLAGNNDYYFTSDGYWIDIQDVMWQTSGGTITQFLSATSNARGNLKVISITNATVATVGGAAASHIENASVIAHNANPLTTRRVENPTGYLESTAPSGIASYSVVYADSTAHRLLASYNNDVFLPIQRERTTSGNSIRLTADLALAANTSLQTIFSWTLPAAALNYDFHCNLLYSQATAAVSNAFGVQGATNAPTNLIASGIVYTAAATSTSGTSGNISTTTATNVLTFTPSAITTVFNGMIDGQIETGASGSTLNIMASQSNSADILTVKRGSYCTLWQR